MEQLLLTETAGKQKISRRKAEDEIHKHIRLQTAEELLKRVDTGFGQKSRAPFQAVVEGVQNSTDAIDKAREALLKSTGSDDYDARIEVSISVVDKSRDELQLTIQDNGIGIPRNKVQIIIRAGGTGTIEYKASRSQQGVGWTAAAIYASQSTGKPLEIISKTFSEKQAHRHVYDYGKGKVTKLAEETYEGEFPEYGTMMSINLIGDYSRARANILEFIKRMAAIHPYISFILKENGTAIEYPKRNSTGIPIPKPVPPHPNSVDIGQLKDMLALQSKIRSISLAGFLKRNFCRIGDKGVKDLLERSSILLHFDERDLFAGDMVKRIAQSSKVQELKNDSSKLAAYLKTLVHEVEVDYDYAAQLVLKGRFNSNLNIRALDNEELKKFFKLSDELPKKTFTDKTTVNMILGDESKVRLLAETLRSMAFPSPPIDSLMPIPDETFVEGFVTIYKPEKYTYIKRNPTSTKGRPVQVQVLAMYGGAIPENLKDQDKLIRIANCTPLLYEFGSDIITQTARDIDWSIYKLGKKGELPALPVIFVAHITSPQLKYLGIAKQAVGADDVIADEIKLALQAASRKLRQHVNLMQRSEQFGKAREFLEKHAEVVALTLSKMLHTKKEKVYEMLAAEIRKRRPVIGEME
ncbi:MAG: DNA topoisomerase VI subunit B [Candidatus Hydrothermarchaeota archaeon]|nr:DNA topoisomerase VI subunit B [Candidatus Hydrothermarchaeota archaeon]